MNIRFLPFIPFSHRKTPTSWKYFTMSRVFFLAFFCFLSLMISAKAGEPQIDIVDSWVEDGYIFHIDFKVPPYHVNCPTTGAGFIGFNVYYKDPRSLQLDWTFGLAPWPDGPASDSKVWSHLTAYAPQAFCTRFSPCTIQNVKMVKTWCPILE
jgi:hypothetical protein